MLTKKAKYALNALVYISNNATENTPITAFKIAQDNDISQKFLESILIEMKKVGLLGSMHGKGGGYYLRRSPNEIQLVEIIRMFDGAVGLIPCVTHHFFEPCKECKDIETCKIRFTFKELRDLNVEFLKKRTLKDLL